MKTNTGVAVIGGGYGDEGKGLVTGFWAQKLNRPITIRFNGGAQAGHTRQLENGRRHVFSHFGSGTFEKSPTFLSRFFVINPILFKKEHEAFVKEFGIIPQIYADSSCLVTTPIEMLINQALETQRGLVKHGSCGVGFGETLERVKQTSLEYRLSYMLDTSLSELQRDIKFLVKEYVPMRLDVDNMSDTLKEVLNSEQMIADYWEALRYFRSNVSLDFESMELYDRDIIFEGAQGLEIDQDYGVFPYVTRSNCGMRNVSTLIDDLALDFNDFKVNYVTRAYKTRHGTGPLRREQLFKPFPYEDKTNVDNEWQGGLRWGIFDYIEYRSITDKDYALYTNDPNLYYNIERIDTMTCMDQIDPAVAEKYLARWGDKFRYVSYGPRTKDIIPVSKWA